MWGITLNKKANSNNIIIVCFITLVRKKVDDDHFICYTSKFFFFSSVIIWFELFSPQSPLGYFDARNDFPKELGSKTVTAKEKRNERDHENPHRVNNTRRGGASRKLT